MKTGDIRTYSSLLALQPNSSPYLLPDYLSIVHPYWELCDSGNFLFPLSSRQLGWLKFCEQPLLTQHFALVGTTEATPEDYTHLLQILCKHFQFIDICVDATGFTLPGGWRIQERITYRLVLPDSPVILRENYNQHLKRILKKPSGLVIKNTVAVSDFLPFLREHLSLKTQLPRRFYTRAEALLRHPALSWQIYGAYAADKLVAACAILNHGNQSYYQLAANAPLGKNLNAMHHLVDHLLAGYCGQELLFDFEGSMIPGLQRFYGGFGAKPYIYTRVSYSSLPWPLSLWKHGIRSK